ncbi:phage portal protein [Arcobacter roscoffensis]|uniref:Phage portal protein n=1 Tax=Arcobacter roscoffensis TaxID=2961520 RepID=A0ABY5E2S3_9BACT|nr:phage portal protein [Arcobacter roscoffensis]UTJ05398.1 phage portal protein [Arcobacter roscoffensis]
MRNFFNSFMETRNNTVLTSDKEGMSEIFSSNKTESGESITKQNAMQISTVFSCIRVLSEGISSLPLHLYKQEGENIEKARIHPLYNILQSEPNTENTAITFWEMSIMHLCLYGNFYAQIIRNRLGHVTRLIPFIPNNVTKWRVEDGTIFYTYQINGKTIHFEQNEIFEVMGMSLDGFTGLSPISYQVETLGLAKSSEKHGARFFKNDATPNFALEHPATLKNDAYERLKKDWIISQGGKNKHVPAILEGGMKIATMSVSNRDSQYLETRQFQKSEICGIFRVPPHLIADLSKSSFNNIQEQSQELVKYTYQPYIIRIEQSINKQLLTKSEKQKYYAKFNVEGLLRGDVKTRYEAYNVARNGGWMNANEIRAKEEMNPIPGGEKYLQPLNMTTTEGNSNED